MKDKKYDNYIKAHHNSWFKTINQRNITRRENTVEQKMGMTADEANETMLARGPCHYILNAERNIIDSEYYTQEKYISKTR